MRSYKEYMIWSHLFLIYEIVFALRLRNYILAFLGISTTILSILYHLTYEQHWQPYEKISAYTTSVYILYISGSTCSWYYFGITLGLTLLTGVWHRFSYMYGNDHYELCHPWLHLLPPLTTHIFQTNC